MLIFGLNLSSRRKKRFPGIDDVIVARPCHWSTSADRFVYMTLKQVLLEKYLYFFGEKKSFFDTFLVKQTTFLGIFP